MSICVCLMQPPPPDQPCLWNSSFIGYTTHLIHPMFLLSSHEEEGTKPRGRTIQQPFASELVDVSRMM